VLGHLAAVELPGSGALAISRGAQPKAYAYTDPNEDGALVVGPESGSLLAVVDGHHGTQAAELALAAVREAWVELLRDDDLEFRHAVQAVVARICDQLRSAGPSRTCLVLAAQTQGSCRWACFGDAVLLRAQRTPPIHDPNPLVLSPNLELPSPELWSGTFALAPGERIAAVSDGVTNFVPNIEQIRVLIEESPGDLEAARDIARAAMQGGAGDNVAVATCCASPADPREDPAQEGTAPPEPSAAQN